MTEITSNTSSKRMIWVADEKVYRLINIYLGDMADGIDGHIEAIDAIRCASEDETIVLHITSRGGETDISDNYIEAIRDSAAHIVTKAIGTVASAGTMVWLAGHERIATDFSAFLFHNVRAGGYDDVHNVKRYLDSCDNYVKTVYLPLYEQILTKEEIVKVYSGQEVHILGAEMQKRVKALPVKSGQEVYNGPRTGGPLPKPVLAVDGEEQHPPFNSPHWMETPEAVMVTGVTNEKVDESTVFEISLDDGYTKTFNLNTLGVRDFDEYNMEELEEIAYAFCICSLLAGLPRKEYIEGLISFLTTGEV